MKCCFVFRAFGLIAAVVLAMVMGCSTAVGPSREPLRVMTFNIRYGTAPDGDHAWVKRRQLVFNLMSEKPYDVIGVQEALRFQIDEILAANPDLAAIGVGRDDGKAKGEHASILYRKSRLTPDPVRQGTVWLSETPEVPGSKHWGNGITRIFTFARFTESGGKGGGAFWVYNTHFDHQSEPARRRSAEAIAAHIASHAAGDRVLLTGDFNCSEQSNAIRYLKGEIPRAWEGGVGAFSSPMLIDTYRVVHPTERAVTTFQGFGTIAEPVAGAWGEKIDFVLMGAGNRGWARVVEAAIDTRTFGAGPTKYPSDHWAVTATLSD